MNLSQALKKKNKIAGELKKLQARLLQVNRYTEPNKPAYDALDVLKQVKEKTKDLIELKTKIVKATIPIQEKIFQIAEYKGFIKSIEYLQTEGSEDTYGFGESQVTRKTIAIIDTLAKDKLIEDYEAEIERLQEDVDRHNATTSI